MMINLPANPDAFYDGLNKASQAIKDFETKMKAGELHAGTYPKGSRVEVMGLKSGMMLVVVRGPETKEKDNPKNTA